MSNTKADTNASELRPVDISFDCMPLRSMARLDPPLDASPALAAKYDRIKAAIAEHGFVPGGVASLSKVKDVA